MIRVAPYTEDFSSAWDQFVNSRPDATVAHPIAWRRVIQDGLRHEPHYFLAHDDSGVRGVLPLYLIKTWWRSKYLVSIPWIDYGGVLADSDEARELLFREARLLAEKVKAQYVEYRSPEPVTDSLPIKTEKVTFLLPLNEDVEVVWKGFHFKLRNHVRKAQKSGLTTELGHLEKLPEFYKVFCWKMHQLGTPVWGYEHFEAVLTHLGEAARIILVKKDDLVIAAGLVLSFGDRLYVPSASSYSQYLKLCPNHALYWDVIRLGCENGYKWFDFGRSTIDSNTYRFKKQWMPEPTQLHWQYDLNQLEEIPAVNPDNPKYRMYIKLWRKMPLSLANLLGPKVIRNFP